MAADSRRPSGVAEEGLEGFERGRASAELEYTLRLLVRQLIDQEKFLEVVDEDGLEVDVELHCVILAALPHFFIPASNLPTKIDGFASGRAHIFKLKLLAGKAAGKFVSGGHFKLMLKNLGLVLEMKMRGLRYLRVHGDKLRFLRVIECQQVEDVDEIEVGLVFVHRLRFLLYLIWDYIIFCVRLS